MGFFSKLKKKVRGQIAPVMPMAPQPLPRVPVMPQRPRMPEALPPRRGPMNRGLSGLMNQIQGQPRMMMAEGRDANMVDFLNSDPRQQIFGIETRIGILENQLQEALANNDRQSYDMIVQQINDADAQRIELMNLPGNLDRSRDQLIASASNRASDPDLFVEEFYGRMDPLPEEREPLDVRSRMRNKRLLDMIRNGSRFRGGKDNARSPSRRDLELIEMQRSQRDSLDDILSDLEKKN
jgi:hypothetical protein